MGIHSELLQRRVFLLGVCGEEGEDKNQYRHDKAKNDDWLKPPGEPFTCAEQDRAEGAGEDGHGHVEPGQCAQMDPAEIAGEGDVYYRAEKAVANAESANEQNLPP